MFTFSIKVKETTVIASKEKVPDYGRLNFTRHRPVMHIGNCSEISNETNIDKTWENFIAILHNVTTLS